jgi:hypothetical protein
VATVALKKMPGVNLKNARNAVIRRLLRKRRAGKRAEEGRRCSDVRFTCTGVSSLTTSAGPKGSKASGASFQRA